MEEYQGELEESKGVMVMMMMMMMMSVSDRYDVRGRVMVVFTYHWHTVSSSPPSSP